MSSKADFINRLNESTSFPSVYMFKFIVPRNEEKLFRLKQLFAEESTVQYRDSSTGKYTSITVKELMISAEAVVEIYEKAAKIEGVMAL